MPYCTFSNPSVRLFYLHQRLKTNRIEYTGSIQSLLLRNLIIHYINEKRLNGYKRDIYQLDNQTFKNQSKYDKTYTLTSASYFLK
jgi:hypothetical protein